jgi:hypothetical protein
MMNLPARVARLERQRRRSRPAQVKSIEQMTDAELLLAAGLPPDISDEAIEARFMAIDWDRLLQQASRKEASGVVEAPAASAVEIDAR